MVHAPPDVSEFGSFAPGEPSDTCFGPKWRNWQRAGLKIGSSGECGFDSTFGTALALCSAEVRAWGRVPGKRRSRDPYDDLGLQTRQIDG